MTPPERAIVTELTITALPPAPLHVVEVWSNPADVSARCLEALGFALPGMGQSAAGDGLTLLRYEPTVWLCEGDPAPLSAWLADDGAITAIGGGIVRMRIAGPGWRSLLMQGGVFNAEAAAFAPGKCAATVIDHVAVRLFVESDEACITYVPTSYAAGLLHFWHDVLPLAEV
jgi:heterotetrameric sarcosine oxidase gamma subunit